MSTELNKSIVQQTYDAFCGGDFFRLENLVNPDVRIHDPRFGELQGIDAFKMLYQVFNTAFPGHQTTVERLLAEGEYVAALHRHTGVHTGPFRGAPATNRPISVPGFELFRVEYGRVTEFWRYDDDAGLLQQLGMIPDAQSMESQAAAGQPAAGSFNERLVRSIYDAYNRRAFHEAARLVTNETRMVNHATGQVLQGPEGYIPFLEGWATAFPDSIVEINQLTVTDTLAVVEFTGRGTHADPLRTPAGDIQATGKRSETEFCDILHLSGGKITGTSIYFDLAGMLAQLGVLEHASLV